MNRCTKAALVVAILAMVSMPALAQDDGGGGENDFLLTGFGFVTYTDTDDTGDGNFDLGLSPIFLYDLSENFLFEVELEIDVAEEGTEVELEYAQLDWIINDNATLVMGKFLTPFGQFIERRHPAWINKLPTMPLMYSHGQSLVPFSQIGVQLRGGIGFGESGRFNYSLMASNGFSPATHGGHGEEAEEGGHDEEGEEEGGHRDEHDEEGGHDEEGEHEEEAEPIFLGAATNSGGDLAYGGRISLIPVQGLEFGASYLSGTYDELGQLDATMMGIDLNYHHELFDLRAEWLNSETELALHEDEVQPEQDVDGWFIQPSLRLSVIPAYFLNRVEAVLRIGEIDFGHRDIEQLAFGLNYYFSGSRVARLAWEQTQESDAPSHDAVTLMFAIGF